MHTGRLRFTRTLLVVAAVGACVTVALFSSAASAHKMASIQACALLPDTKSSTRYTLFDAPYRAHSAARMQPAGALRSSSAVARNLGLSWTGRPLPSRPLRG